MAHAIEARGIGKNYGDNEVLRDIDFHARRGEFVSFVGPSGCGKSTLFNVMTGLLPPSSGDVLVHGRTTTGRTSPEIGYVLQKDLLLPWRTMLGNVVLGLEVRGVARKEATERARELFAAYGMAGFENRYPAQVSGGMRQRAALMRTMLLDPEVILMDEAYKALDYPLKIQLESELLAMVRESSRCVVFVTHDIEEAVTLSDRVYVLKARPGQIVEEIEVDLGVSSTRIEERRMSPRFNEFYERIWRGIDAPAVAAGASARIGR
ncbi:ABC transporter ATP-binding protein [Saccharomonospora sp. NPDC046836]|uniref:ABC transporter ATP-binding protein n=1 Tax=Saccharomonospora sp. NPDC046836 TaxID=3156921 RepID=UPI003408D4CC